MVIKRLTADDKMSTASSSKQDEEWPVIPNIQCTALMLNLDNSFFKEKNCFGCFPGG